MSREDDLRAAAERLRTSHVGQAHGALGFMADVELLVQAVPGLLDACGDGHAWEHGDDCAGETGCGCVLLSARQAALAAGSLKAVRGLRSPDVSAGKRAALDDVIEALEGRPSEGRGVLLSAEDASLAAEVLTVWPRYTGLRERVRLSEDESEYVDGRALLANNDRVIAALRGTA